MTHFGRPAAEWERSEEIGPLRVRSLYPYWPPRPAMVVAGLLVGSSLFWMAFVDRDFARDLSDLYGWPFCYRLARSARSGWSGLLLAAALVADLGVSLALLASACATTQIAACLLVRSPRITLRIVGFVVAVIALFLAGCRLNKIFLTDVFRISFYYSVASLIALVICLLFGLELPRRDDAEPGG